MSHALDVSAPVRTSRHPLPHGPGPVPEADLAAAIRNACERVAPLWPLADWVAVNPFLGFAGQRFEAAARDLARLGGVRTTMPRSFYRQALNAGRMTAGDIAWALVADGADLHVATILRGLESDATAATGPGARIATVAEVLDRLADGDRQVSRTAFMVDEISRWCAAYFDVGQAAWSPPWRDKPLYAAWREATRFDANPGAMGIRGFAAAVAQVPGSSQAAIAYVLDRLAIPAAHWGDYLFRALFDIRGWAAYVRRLDWEGERAGRPSSATVDLLAIRVVWGFVLYSQRADPAFAAAWSAAMDQAVRPPPAEASADLRCDLVLQRAYERAYQRRLMAELAVRRPAQASIRPAMQAVFCIDVRSEVYRRRLEAACPEVATFGFAGFFGMPLAYAADGAAPQAQCPVLLAPSARVTAGAPPDTRASVVLGLGELTRRLKASAVSAFGFVEAFGLAYLGKLSARAARVPTPPKPPPAPPLAVDLSVEQRITLAEGALRGMSLTRAYARLVVLVGHGSTSANNPHAAGLACGACGGHDGAPNARVAAKLLNDPIVREGLAFRGLHVPEETWFAAALHDTTTDEVWVLDGDDAPATHRRDLDEARRRFAAASAAARGERARRFSDPNPAAVTARSRDWSQVRPEWGLAGAAAFIAAPRTLTRGRDLEGRVFLHDYDRRLDGDLQTLDMILTAPVVVASWISLQYYGSTIDNTAFGAGDKTLHNVCAGVGVLEGNAGDLRAGLPLQSVHDGARFVHEPVRLSVFVAAEPAAISEVLSRRPAIADLADNGWLHLFALDDEGLATHRYVGGLKWEDAD